MRSSCSNSSGLAIECHKAYVISALPHLFWWLVIPDLKSDSVMLTRTAILLSIATLLCTAVARAESIAGVKTVDFRLPDSLGNEHALTDFADQELIVVAFLGTECPLAKLYAARLQLIADEYAERGVAVVAVMSNAQDSLGAQGSPQRGG
jgi:hypothetical protein